MAIYMSAFAQRTSASPARFSMIREVEGPVRDANAADLKAAMAATPIVCRVGSRLIPASDCMHCHRFVNCLPDQRGSLKVRCLWSDEDPIADLMTPADELITVVPEATAAEADRIARQCHVRHLVVADGDRFLGVICRCDLVGASAHESIGARAAHCPWTVGPEDSLGSAATVMRERQVGCLPVIQDRQLIGVITRGDLRRAGVPETALGGTSCSVCGSRSGVLRDEQTGQDKCLRCVEGP